MFNCKKNVIRKENKSCKWLSFTLAMLLIMTCVFASGCDDISDVIPDDSIHTDPTNKDDAVTIPDDSIHTDSTNKDTETTTGCNHDYIERDGRVFCTICKEICQHHYEKQGSDMYCSNCMYKCKHSFKTVDEQRICEYCNTACNHNYELKDGTYRCTSCGSICSHNYTTIDDKMICSECGYTKIILSLENIQEYLNISCRYEFVEKMVFSLSSEMCIKGKITFDITPKKDVHFTDLRVTVNFSTQGNGWSSSWDYFSKTVDLPYDGNGSFILDIRSPIVSKAAILMNSPLLVKPIIIEVTGTVEY